MVKVEKPHTISRRRIFQQLQYQHGGDAAGATHPLHIDTVTIEKCTPFRVCDFPTCGRFPRTPFFFFGLLDFQESSLLAGRGSETPEGSGYMYGTGSTKRSTTASVRESTILSNSHSSSSAGVSGFSSRLS